MRVHRSAVCPILVQILDLRRSPTPARRGTSRPLGLLLFVLLVLLSPTQARADESTPCPDAKTLKRSSIVDLRIQANDRTFHRRAGPVEAMKVYQDVKDYVKTLPKGTRVRMCIWQTTENWVTYRCPDGTETPTRLSVQESPEACMNLLAR